jgi:hypothetical protein
MSDAAGPESPPPPPSEPPTVQSSVAKEEPPPMHPHKPKPVHGWREFLTEICIIVIGVLIALSLEQAVENWREHRQYEQARQALRDELEYNVSFLRYRERYEPCTRQRLQDIGLLLDRAESHRPFDAPHWIGNVSSIRIRFTAEAEAGRSGLFAAEEQATLGRLYVFLHVIDTEQDRERLAWARLRMLEDHGNLSPEMIVSLRGALADAQYEHDRIQETLGYVGAFARRAGIRSDADIEKISGVAARPDQYAHCLPMQTPRQEGEKRAQVSFRGL